MTQVSALKVTPLTAPIDVETGFEALRSRAYPWLLDSGAAPGVPSQASARFTFMGADPYLVLRARGRECEVECLRGVAPELEEGTSNVVGDPLEIARSLLPQLDSVEDEVANSIPFLGGAIGYFGYELGEVCEPVALTGRDDFALPDMVLLFVDRLLVIDHLEQRAFAVGLGFEADDEGPGANEKAREAARYVEDWVASRGANAAPIADERDDDWSRKRQMLGSGLPRDARASFSPHEYGIAVESIREEIAAGNVYQANLTQRIDLSRPAAKSELDADVAWQTYRKLRRLSPAPFAAFIQLPEVSIASSSPERFLRVDRNRCVESRPIKGTRRRGNSEEEDTLLAKELARSVKDRAENLMIVDLVRNDLGRVCETGSVEVPELMSIERYASVFQMVSTVRGTLRRDRGFDDLFRATFPPGSMTGAPKIAAMKLIDRIEPVRRGIYSGAIGYLDVAGGLDLSVVIRTLLVRGGEVHLHSGGAVVSDSVAEDEYLESLDKIRALLLAIGCCE